MKALVIAVCANMAALCLNVAAYAAGVTPLALAATLALLHIMFMVRPLRMVWAELQWTRGTSRARRSIEASKRARRETQQLVDDLQQSIERAQAFAESARAEGRYTEIDREEQLAELNHLLRGVKAAQAITDGKQAEAKAAVEDLDRLLEKVHASANPEPRYATRLANGLVDIAVLLAGPANAHLADTWRADMIGAPEDGLVLSPRQRLTHARGLILASLRIRAAAVIQPLWRPVDWLLGSTKRVDTVVATVVGAMAIYLSRNLHDLLTDASGPCVLAFTLLKAGAARLRRARGIELIGRVQPGSNRQE